MARWTRESAPKYQFRDRDTHISPSKLLIRNGDGAPGKGSWIVYRYRLQYHLCKCFWAGLVVLVAVRCSLRRLVPCIFSGVRGFAVRSSCVGSTVASWRRQNAPEWAKNASNEPPASTCNPNLHSIPISEVSGQNPSGSASFGLSGYALSLWTKFKSADKLRLVEPCWKTVREKVPIRPVSSFGTFYPTAGWWYSYVRPAILYYSSHDVTIFRQ